VMMPVIAQEAFEMMQVSIGAIRAFTEKGVSGLTANPSKATAWLERNAIIATALNPLIGYAAAAELVKEAVRQNRSIRALAQEQAAAGKLMSKDNRRPVTVAEIDSALGNLRRMTDGGLL